MGNRDNPWRAQTIDSVDFNEDPPQINNGRVVLPGYELDPRPEIRSAAGAVRKKLRLQQGGDPATEATPALTKVGGSEQAACTPVIERSPEKGAPRNGRRGFTAVALHE